MVKTIPLDEPLEAETRLPETELTVLVEGQVTEMLRLPVAVPLGASTTVAFDWLPFAMLIVALPVAMTFLSLSRPLTVKAQEPSVRLSKEKLPLSEETVSVEAPEGPEPTAV
jgi:hypothetical protein